MVAKVNNIDTTDFVLKTNYQTDKTEIEKKIPDATGFVKNTKLAELENKIPDVISLATKTALAAVENKIPCVSSLVKKTNYHRKICELEKTLTDHDHAKYVATSEFNTLVANVFNRILARANLITKTDFDAKLSSLNRKLTANKSKNFLVENELKKLKTFDSCYFIGKNHFEEDGTQNYLVFQPINRYLEVIANTDYVSSWESKGLSNKTINPPDTSDNSLNPTLIYYGTKMRAKFNGSCLQKPKAFSIRGD